MLSRRTVVLGSSLFALILAWSLYDRSSGQQHEAKLMLGPCQSDTAAAQSSSGRTMACCLGCT